MLLLTRLNVFSFRWPCNVTNADFISGDSYIRQQLYDLKWAYEKQMLWIQFHFTKLFDL
jgi:hypothetical protein